MSMKWTQVGMAVGLALILGACVSPPQYPETPGSDVDPNFDFKNLRDSLDQYKGSVFQVAGEMVRVESGSEGVRVMANRRWIQPQQSYPYNIPVESGEPPQDQFLVSYPGKLDAQGMRLGNKFVAVVELVGASGDLLSFRVRCMHVWKTGQSRISELPDRFVQLYQALEEDTYCASGPQAASR